ncbi:MAG: hypothetical protein M0P69_18195 [Bacteroidales bacterium]|nr:hypothetical protein [Bacteroidales bacterium]
MKHYEEMSQYEKEIRNMKISDYVLGGLILAIILFFCAVQFCSAAPVEIWLTKERAAALKRVADQPRITAKEKQPDGTVIYHWTRGSETYATTQQVVKIAGKKARSAWSEKLDAEKFEKERIIQEIKAIKGKPTAKALDAILKNHEDREATPVEFRFGRDTSGLIH